MLWSGVKFMGIQISMVCHWVLPGCLHCHLCIFTGKHLLNAVDDAILMQFDAAFALEKCVLWLVMTVWKMVTRKQSVHGHVVIIVLAYVTFLLPLHISYIMQNYFGLSYERLNDVRGAVILSYFSLWKLTLCRSNLKHYCMGRKAAFFSVGI